MPLSPFRARLALSAFLAVAAGIGTNLLVVQSPPAPIERANSFAPSEGPAGSTDSLGRKALDALIGSALVAPTPFRSTRPALDRKLEQDARRVGSFAPSSGTFPRMAMPGGDPAEVRRATIKGVQAELVRKGYEPGQADGTAGLVTRAAVMAYQHDQGLPLTAEPSPEILAHLRHGTSAPGAAVGLDANAPRNAGQAEQVIRAVQQALRKLGYLASAPDGLVSDDTVRAIREFEMDGGLVPSGRISGPLVARLAKQAAGARAQ